MSENQVMNIMIVTNSAYLKPSIVLLDSIFVRDEGPIDVYLPYEDIQEKELEELQAYFSLWPGKRLIPIYVGTEFKEAVTSRSGIQIETYYRIIGWDLLPESVEKILYLDVDMVARGSLRGLYNLEMGDKLFAVCEDIFGKIQDFHEANKMRLGIPKEGNYFNAGTILVNVQALRKEQAVKHILDCVYKDYERYEYNDQDVLNEQYQDRLLYVGWDQFNCPPAWYYLDKEAMLKGQLQFVPYNALKGLLDQPDQIQEKYVNITSQIADSALIIHYLADTKPWKKTRELTKLYELFDKYYWAAEEPAKERYQSVNEQTTIFD